MNYNPLKRISTGDVSFGYSCATNGNYLIIGASNETVNGLSGAGAAYIYNLNDTSWNPQRVSAADSFEGTTYQQESAAFGSSCAISDIYLIIGASNETVNGLSGAGAAYIYKFDGSVWSPSKRIKSNSVQYGGSFGKSCAICGDYLIVGAPFESYVLYNEGRVYLYKLNGTSWGISSTISSTATISGTPAAYTHNSGYFGYSCAISDYYLVIGASNEQTSSTVFGAGAAYIYKFNGSAWGPHLRISAANSFEGTTYQIDNAAFGWSCAINSNYLVIGAYTESDSNSAAEEGAAYIYKFDGSTWGPLKRLSIHTSFPDISFYSKGYAHFGNRCSIMGDYLVITASGENEYNGNRSVGAAYIYKLNGSTWGPLKRISASDSFEGSTYGGIYNAQFGISCTMKGDYLVIGHNNNTAAFIYKLGSYFTQNKTLKITDTSEAVPASAQFGFSCAVNGIYLIIGACKETITNANVGAVYIYTWNGSLWGSSYRIPGSTSAGYFGYSCAITKTNGNYYVLIGAPGESTYGAAYLYIWNGSIVTSNKIIYSDTGLGTPTYVANYLYNFGCSCSISGNYLVIGFASQGSASYYFGSAYIFYFNGTSTLSCNFVKKLTGADNGIAYGNYSYYYGCSCNILENNIVICSLEDTFTGAAYTYILINNIWTYNNKLSMTNSGDTKTNYTYFGISCAISNKFLIIGASGNSGGTVNSTGAVYIYMWNGFSWNFNKKLLQSDCGTTIPNTYFGWSCAISGNYLIVSAFKETNDYGAIYIYNWNGSNWLNVQKFTSDTTSISANAGQFGYSCAMSDNFIAASANLYDFTTPTAYTDTGIVCTFKNNNLAITPVLSNGFINGCAISNNNIVIGNTGKTHTFKWSGSTWNTLSTIN